MGISDDYFKNDKPPVELWVITRDRARAGKPPFRIAPQSWVRTGETSKPWGVKAGKSERYPEGRIYSLNDCFISLQASRNHLSRIIDDELAHERRKLQQLKNRLNRSMDSANQINKFQHRQEN
jgi:hypothetical protein